MEQIRSTDWMRHIPKILIIGAFLAIIGVFLPSAHVFESIYGYSFTSFIWYFGFIWATLGGESESLWMSEVYGSLGDDYTKYGIIAMVLIIFAFILLIVGANYAKDGRDNKLSAGTSLIGGILALVGPAVFYFGVKADFPGFWGFGGFDTSFGVYLPIIAGLLGIGGAIGSGYAFFLESKGELRQKVPYQPFSDKMEIEKGPEANNQQERPVFCKNCGMKLVGEYCQECGQKAEF